jgi:hypothetical protein
MARETTINEKGAPHPDRPPGTRERVPRLARTRASKRRLRAMAWLAAGIGFASPAAAIALVPKPPEGSAPVQRPIVIVHRKIRRIVITPRAPTTPPPRVTYVPAGGASGTSSTGTTRCSGC